jgi:glutathione S-transferase
MTMKLIIGNKAYSSWSLRGWLAAKQSGLHFDEMTVPLFDDGWDERKREEDLAPSSGKVPILWDGETVVWDSLAIIDWLADKVGRDRYWPKDEVARGMARSMAAEMHSGYPQDIRECLDFGRDARRCRAHIANLGRSAVAVRQRRPVSLRHL